MRLRTTSRCTRPRAKPRRSNGDRVRNRSWSKRVVTLWRQVGQQILPGRTTPRSKGEGVRAAAPQGPKDMKARRDCSCVAGTAKHQGDLTMMVASRPCLRAFTPCRPLPAPPCPCPCPCASTSPRRRGSPSSRSNLPTASASAWARPGRAPRASRFPATRHCGKRRRWVPRPCCHWGRVACWA